MILVSDYLHKGAAHPQTARELCNLLDLDKRALQAAIERERRQGIPICASCTPDTQGYYLASNKAEMQRYCDSLHKRAAEIYKTRDACLNTIEKLPEEEGSCSK